VLVFMQLAAMTSGMDSTVFLRWLCGRKAQKQSEIRRGIHVACRFSHLASARRRDGVKAGWLPL